MSIAKQYAWLESEAGPRILKTFVSIIGTTEVPGPANNPEIMAWANKIGVAKTYTADSIPWCGLGMAYVALESGWGVPVNPLWARSWASWGIDVPAGQEALANVLVFGRKGGGHVGIYVGEDKTHFHVLGCNQSDSTNIKRIPKSRLLAARECPWRVSRPDNIRKIMISPVGAVSQNEK